MKTKTIFLAEGETHVREALHLLLENQEEFSVAGESNSAESTLAQVCQNPPNAILLDWDLPGINHQRLIHALRVHCPTTSLIVLSVKPEHELVAQQAGADTFIAKQLPPDQFLAALHKCFEK